MIYNNILDTIGNTPIVKINNLGENIYVKLEKYNPGGSIKDRAVYIMIEEMEKRGELKKGDTLVEATSGNTGIALTMISKLKGYDVIIVMPETMSKERRSIITNLGAKLLLTDGKLGMKGAIVKAQELLNINKNYKTIKQFENEDNAYGHYKTTGAEIYKDVKDIDIFVAGIGTAGTLIGVGRYLKEKNPNIKIIGVESKNSPIISQDKSGEHKIQGIGAGFIPKIYDSNIVDEIIVIDDNKAIETMELLAKKEGMLVGISSGANIYASILISEKYKDKKIVTVAPDGIEKYLSL